MTARQVRWVLFLGILAWFIWARAFYLLAHS